MKTGMWFTCAGLGLALIVSVATARRSNAADDESASIRKQCSAFVSAWNAHDPKAMAAVFAPDGDAIDPFGHAAAGREAVEKAFTADQTGNGPMRESSVEVLDEPIRLVTPDVALSDADVVLTGAYGPGGVKAGPMGLHVTNIWKKTGGTWYIFASRPHLKMPATPPSAPGPSAPK